MLGWVGKCHPRLASGLAWTHPLELAEGGPYCLLSTRKGHLAK